MQVISAQSDSISSILATYASLLADLEQERADLARQITSANRIADEKMATDTPDLSGVKTTSDTLTTKLFGFNSRVSQADQDTADALRKIRTAGDAAWAGAVHTLAVDPGAFAMGLAGSTLSDLRNVTDLTVAALQRSGLATPSGRRRASATAQDARGRSTRAKSVTAPNLSDTPARSRRVSVAEPTKFRVARFGGGALGAAGAVFTVADTYSASYHGGLVEHPEWSEGKRREDAGVTAAVVGGASAAGGIAGGIAGAEAGAFIGTMVFPGVGTVVGGLIGGLLGGYMASKLGESAGTEWRTALKRGTGW